MLPGYAADADAVVAARRLRLPGGATEYLTRWAIEHSRAGLMTTLAIGDVMAELAWMPSMTAEQMYGWLGLIGNGPDAPANMAIEDMLCARMDAQGIHAALTTRSSWMSLGEIGPLAYAAGLTVDEAIERYAAGTLDHEAIVVMVGLRGWRLPPLPLSAHQN